MSSVQETNHISFHLVPESKEGSKRTADASSVIATLNNLLQKLSQEGTQGNSQKQIQNLLNQHLGKIVDSVEQMIKDSGAPPELGKQILLELLMAVQEVQSLQAETSMVSSEVESKGSEASVQNAADQEKQVMQEVQEQENEPWWKKVLGIVVKVIVPVVLVAVGVLTGQPELAFAGIMMAVMADTPLMSDLTKGFESLLTDLKVPKKDAQWIAGLFTVATVAIVTGGVGAIGDVALGADEAVETATNVAEKALGDVVDDATTATTEDATETVSETAVDKSSKEGEDKQKISLKKKGFKMGGAMALSAEAPNISQGLIESLPISNPTVKKVLEALSTILLEITAVVTLVSTGSMSTTADGALSQKIEKLTKGVTDLVNEKMPGLVGFVSDTTSSALEYLNEKAPELMDFLERHKPTAEKVARGVKIGAVGATASADIGNGVYAEQQSKIIANMGEHEAALSLDQAADKMGQSLARDNLGFEQTMTKELGKIMEQISHFGFVGSAEAETVASNI